MGLRLWIKGLRPTVLGEALMFKISSLGFRVSGFRV